MVMAQARKLHAGDEVRIKSTQEVVRVISATPYCDQIFISALTQNGYVTLAHKEVQ